MCSEILFSGFIGSLLVFFGIAVVAPIFYDRWQRKREWRDFEIEIFMKLMGFRFALVRSPASTPRAQEEFFSALNQSEVVFASVPQIKKALIDYRSHTDFINERSGMSRKDEHTVLSDLDAVINGIAAYLDIKLGDLSHIDFQSPFSYLEK